MWTFFFTCSTFFDQWVYFIHAFYYFFLSLVVDEHIFKFFINAMENPKTDLSEHIDKIMYDFLNDV